MREPDAPNKAKGPTTPPAECYANRQQRRAMAIPRLGGSIPEDQRRY